MNQGYLIKELDWDSEVLGVKSGIVIACDPMGSGMALPDCLQTGKQQGFVFLTYKVDTQSADQVNEAFRLGGTLVDTELTFQQNSSVSNSSGREIPGVKISKESGFWDERLLPIAGEFKFSRFFKDPRIGEIKARKLWQESLKNHCLGRASYTLLARVKGEPAGLICVNESGGCSDLFLVGVLPDHQGKGVGRLLMEHYFNNLSSSIKFCTVETQLDNISAIAFYLKAGYQIARSKHIIHFWL